MSSMLSTSTLGTFASPCSVYILSFTVKPQQIQTLLNLYTQRVKKLNLYRENRDILGFFKFSSHYGQRYTCSCISETRQYSLLARSEAFGEVSASHGTLRQRERDSCIISPAPGQINTEENEPSEDINKSSVPNRLSYPRRHPLPAVCHIHVHPVPLLKRKT